MKQFTLNLECVFGDGPLLLSCRAVEDWQGMIDFVDDIA
jgi:hypothetical protein